MGMDSIADDRLAVALESQSEQQSGQPELAGVDASAASAVPVGDSAVDRSLISVCVQYERRRGLTRFITLLPRLSVDRAAFLSALWRAIRENEQAAKYLGVPSSNEPLVIYVHTQSCDLQATSELRHGDVISVQLAAEPVGRILGKRSAAAAAAGGNAVSAGTPPLDRAATGSPAVSGVFVSPMLPSMPPVPAAASADHALSAPAALGTGGASAVVANGYTGAGVGPMATTSAPGPGGAPSVGVSLGDGAPSTRLLPALPPPVLPVGLTGNELSTQRKITEHLYSIRTCRPAPRDHASEPGLLCLAAYVVLRDAAGFMARLPHFAAALRASRQLRAEWARLNYTAFSQACRRFGIDTPDVLTRLPVRVDWEAFAVACDRAGVRFEPLPADVVERILSGAVSGGR